MLEAITPMLRLLPSANLRACRLGGYLSFSMAFSTRVRVAGLTTVALFNTRDTVAVETLARRATCSRFMPVRTIVSDPRGGFGGGSAYNTRFMIVYETWRSAYRFFSGKILVVKTA